MNKSEINAKVLKVREVVKTVSNDDIILALHAYDFNVERTIQAFCEDGASGVLDDWVRPAGSSNKKNKNKKKKAAIVEAAPVTSAPVKPAPAVVNNIPSASLPPAASAPAPAASKPTPATTSTTSNRVSNENKAQPTSAVQNNIHEVFQALHNAISEREQALLTSSNKNSAFVGDVNQLIAQIRNFGALRDPSQKAPQPVQQKAASPVPTGIKHATSQSSISSSVGADSGVNLSPTHQEEKKVAKSNTKVAQVASGGIQMSSDALSEDQLAALQRTLQASLAAHGIDASVLSGVTNGDMPARKQQRKPQDRKMQQKEGGKAARPQLSILG